MNVLVLTISDRVSQGIYEDLSGPAIEQLLQERFPLWKIKRTIVSDEPAYIQRALQYAHDNLFECVITTGGTGIGPRDSTPEVTRNFCNKLLPGIAEMLRREFYKDTVHAVLSRGEAGMHGKMLIINLPGSQGAAMTGAKLLAPVIEHTVAMVNGEGH